MSEAEARKKLSEYASELAALDEVTPDTGGDASKIEMLMVNLIQEVKELRTDLSKDKAAYDTKIAHLEEENTQLRAIGYQHQRFLEQIDSRMRESNVVIMGVPDGNLKLKDKSTDKDKYLLIFQQINAGNINVIEVKRLGEEKADRTRPILIRLENRAARDSLIEKAKELKEKEEPFKSIYIKKDIHPMVRKEWKRLNDAETALKNDPNNQGCTIALDPKKRVITKDQVVVDRWQPNFFS